MSLFKDPYETSTGSMSDIKHLKHSIQESVIKDGLFQRRLNVKQVGEWQPVFITGTQPSEAEIPLFTHPITIITHGHEKLLCTDLRVFIRKDTPIDNIGSGVKNFTEFNFAKSRALMSLIWLENGQSKLRSNLQFAGTVYAAWLAETISKTFALDFKDQTTIAIIASYFYQSLFEEDSKISEETKQRMAVVTAKATKAPAELVFQIFDKIGQMDDIHAFCATIEHIVENVRLKGFNLALLLTIVKNSWYGTNAKEIISVALEHPPTWCAVVYTALAERTYKSSMIYRVAERFGKRGGSDEFMASYALLANSMIEKPQAMESFQVREYE